MTTKGRNRPPAGKPTDLILLSSAEVGFLRKVTRAHSGHSSQEVPEVHHSLREKLERLYQDDDSRSDRYLLTVTSAELSLLHDLTKAAYSFITTEERRARLVLREKMYVSSRKLGLPLD